MNKNNVKLNLRNVFKSWFIFIILKNFYLKTELCKEYGGKGQRNLSSTCLLARYVQWLSWSGLAGWKPDGWASSMGGRNPNAWAILPCFTGPLVVGSCFRNGIAGNWTRAYMTWKLYRWWLPCCATGPTPFSFKLAISNHLGWLERKHILKINLTFGILKRFTQLGASAKENHSKLSSSNIMGCSSSYNSLQSKKLSQSGTKVLPYQWVRTGNFRLWARRKVERDLRERVFCPTHQALSWCTLFSVLLRKCSTQI